MLVYYLISGWFSCFGLSSHGWSHFSHVHSKNWMEIDFYFETPQVSTQNKPMGFLGKSALEINRPFFFLGVCQAKSWKQTLYSWWWFHDAQGRTRRFFWEFFHRDLNGGFWKAMFDDSIWYLRVLKRGYLSICRLYFAMKHVQYPFLSGVWLASQDIVVEIFGHSMWRLVVFALLTSTNQWFSVYFAFLAILMPLIFPVL